MKSKTGWNRAHAGGRGSVLLLLLTAALWGCGAERIQHSVSLHYEGADAPRLFEPPQAPTIVVAAFQDRRTGKENLGIYQWQNLTVEMIPKGGTASAGVTEMARAFVERMGLRPAPGVWDGEVTSLPGVEGDYALYGEILALNFTGEGSLPDAKNRGTVAIEVRLGSRASRTVVRRSVEVAPEEFQFILFDNRYEHIGRMEQIIRRSVSRAIRDGLTDLVRRANAGTPGQTQQEPSGGEPSPFERFQRR
ncbi:MAG: hypothetical protein A3J27_15565 [Candidatus Tectomicrobia bacterium RIFCSPLOWO2_12_FULL_69_37]|nr:MAG: hypothetical protein A3I72_15850 [Candidatus Tectomicrobia bacterium RIFCSPLOWO2_02_FULL_70_19]OGL63510.1 MAG: hypothetical protein A3J27_15565 [Candidatus Tectomicrobia bacterium RIFCSPLOWO2_12_FULL_69_37]